MKNIITITSKELKSYFISPIAYVITTVFLILIGYMFFSRVSAYSLECFKLMNYSKAVEAKNVNIEVFMRNFQTMTTIIMFMIPIITMRVFAEEKKNKTMELLMTSPVSVSEIVIGKFLASFIMFIVMCSLTIYMPLFVSVYSNLDWGPIFTGYLGILLIGGVFISIGIFTSALTENQVVAALISFGIILIFFAIEWLASFSEGITAYVLRYLSLISHLLNFLRGSIVSQNVIYYLSFTALMLFMTFRVIESKRWKQ